MNIFSISSLKEKHEQILNYLVIQVMHGTAIYFEENRGIQNGFYNLTEIGRDATLEATSNSQWKEKSYDIAHCWVWFLETKCPSRQKNKHAHIECVKYFKLPKYFFTFFILFSESNFKVLKGILCSRLDRRNIVEFYKSRNLKFLKKSWFFF